MIAVRVSAPWLSNTTSNQASASRSVPVAAANAATHGERRHAATAVPAKPMARAMSNPVHATSQRRERCSGGSDADSQIAHGTRAMPIAPKTGTTQSRMVLER